MRGCGTAHGPLSAAGCRLSYTVRRRPVVARSDGWDVLQRCSGSRYAQHITSLRCHAGLVMDAEP